MDIFPFHSLNNSQLINELNLSCGSDIPMQRSCYENLFFNPDSINDGENILDNIDPDRNLDIDTSFFVPSNYYHSNEFFNMLKTNENYISLLFINIRSLVANFEQFNNYYLSDMMPSITIIGLCEVIGLCETRLTDDLERNFVLPNYSLYSNNNSRSSGGVALYVRDIIPGNIIPDLCFMSHFCESLFLELTLNNHKEIIGVVYRRPDSNVTEFILRLSEILTKITQTGKKCHIMGDFNFNLLQYDVSPNVQNYVDTMYSSGFFPCTNKPTRVTSHSATIIDVIWTNDIEKARKNGILFSDVTDHFAPFTIVKRCRMNNEPVRVTYRDYGYNSGTL